MIKKFNIFKNLSLNESVTLTDEEKKFLWKKIEYTKKKKAIDTENELFNILNGESNEIDDTEFKIILRSLEYSFRKKLIGETKPMNLEVFKNIVDKLPNDWIAVKYSSLAARKKRKPNSTWTKTEIKKYLDSKKIKYTDKMTNKQLLDLLKM